MSFFAGPVYRVHYITNARLNEAYFWYPIGVILFISTSIVFLWSLKRKDVIFNTTYVSRIQVIAINTRKHLDWKCLFCVTGGNLRVFMKYAYSSLKENFQDRERTFANGDLTLICRFFSVQNTKSRTLLTFWLSLNQDLINREISAEKPRKTFPRRICTYRHD